MKEIESALKSQIQINDWSLTEEEIRDKVAELITLMGNGPAQALFVGGEDDA